MAALMRVLQLKRLNNYAPPAEHYTFSLGIGGFIINYMLYQRETGAILGPLTAGRKRVWRGRGAQVNALRRLIESNINAGEVESL